MQSQFTRLLAPSVSSRTRIIIEKQEIAIAQRNPTLCILYLDRGAVDGENGYIGHRVSEETVWTVPYFEGI